MNAIKLSMVVLSLCIAMLVFQPVSAQTTYISSVQQLDWPITQSRVAVFEGASEVIFTATSNLLFNGSFCANLKLVASDGNQTKVVALVPKCDLRRKVGESIQLEYALSKSEIERLMAGHYFSAKYTDLTVTLMVVDKDTAEEDTVSRSIRLADYPKVG